MAVSTANLKALLQKSGNRCAFPGCPEFLLHNEADENVILGKIAHIVGQSADGPRGSYALPMDERDDEENLILLCAKHHDIIDAKPQFYTVERLRQFKNDHEFFVKGATEKPPLKANIERLPRVREGLFSTLLPVVELPPFVFGAPCDFAETDAPQIASLLGPPASPGFICPYIIRAGQLYAFQDLRKVGPFDKVIDRSTAVSIRSSDWWDDPIRQLWFVDLLNRASNKLTGRRGLRLDKRHHRYYFCPDEPGQAKEITYRPLNQALTTRFVVWQPKSKKTGESRPFWLHWAVSLKYFRVTAKQWCLTIRPEMRVTKDGITSEESSRIGGRVTRRKSRTFNYNLLSEINFWRDFLSDGEPRIVLTFDVNQRLIISTNIVRSEIEWPGIPKEFAKPFKNIEYAEDLFSLAKLRDSSVAEVEETEEDDDENEDEEESEETYDD